VAGAGCGTQLAAVRLATGIEAESLSGAVETAKPMANAAPTEANRPSKLRLRSVLIGLP
jgi:hypothetical protein